MRIRVFRSALVVLLASRSLVAQNTGSATIDPLARSSIIDSLAAQLRRHYVRPAVAESLVAGLRELNTSGAFARAGTPETFAATITAAMHRIVRDDAHLTVRFTPPEPKPVASAVAAAPIEERQRARAAFVRDAREESFGIPEVRTLPGNVGYVRVGEFLYQTMMGTEPFSRPTIVAAMQLVAERDALILDLRENRGGHTAVPSLILSYLFDRPTPLGSSRARDGSVSYGSTFDVVGPKFGGTKPLFVLTSDSTFSAGEGIASALRAAHRARIVGARTRGGASSGDFYAIGFGLRAFIPDEQHFDANGASLESIGVTPDVVVSPPKALDLAYKLALDTLAKLEPDAARRAKLDTLARRPL